MQQKNLKHTITTLAAFFGVVVFLSIPLLVLAQVDFGTDYLAASGLGTQDIRVTIVNILRIMYGILGVLTLVIISYAGWIWMTSGGKQDRILRAKKIIINAVIGLLIIIMAYAITEFIFRSILQAQNGGGGFSCKPSVCVASCNRCNATGDGTLFDTSCTPCGIGADLFNLEEVQTAHPPGPEKQDVYTCSNIQPRFNNRIKADTVLPNVELVNVASGVAVPGTWSISTKTLKFTPDNNFSITTLYEARFTTDPLNASIPGLKDQSGDPLNDCVGTTCETSAPPFFGWQFETGTETDIIAPFITSAYPLLDGEPGYPSRTVPRSPTIDVNFNESIDFFTIEDAGNLGHPDPAKFTLQEVNCPGNAPPCTPTGNVISNDDLNLFDMSSGFRIKVANGLLLDSFAWYQITVQDVEDLCGNPMDPSPVSWVFQTSDAVPGVSSVSPPNGATNVCPDQSIYFTFGTSMYDEMVWFVIDDGGGPQGINLQATEVNTSVTTFLGTLSVIDPDLPVDNNFRSFRFTPTAPLTIGNTYSLGIEAPNYIINTSGDTLVYPVAPNTWSFTVASAATCSCSPYISRLLPSQGPHGQCLSIIGACFEGTAAKPGNITLINFGSDTITPPYPGQGPNYVTTEVPNTVAQNTSHQVRLELTYNDPNYGSLLSNSNNFFVTADPAYTGPCLYAISPGDACNGEGVTLSGIRFGDTQTPPNDYVDFSISGQVPAGDMTSWSNTQIKFDVPAGWPPGAQFASVFDNLIMSNALPFNISCIGAGCAGTGSPPLCLDAAACTGSTYCETSNCLCEPLVGCAGTGSPPLCLDAAACPSNTYCETSNCLCEPLVGCAGTGSPPLCLDAAACTGSTYCETSNCLCEPLVGCDDDGDVTNGCPNISACPANTTCNSLDCLCWPDSTNTFSVTDFWPACNDACLNSALGAEFSSDVDSNTVRNDPNPLLDTVDVLPCTDSNCDVFKPEITYDLNVVGAQIQISNITLVADGWYRVILDGEIAGVNGVKIDNLNYPIPGADSYSWTFHVQNTGVDCPPTAVETYPTDMTINGILNTKPIAGNVYSDQGCDGYQPIDPWPYDWSWYFPVSLDPVATVSNENGGDGVVDPFQTVTARRVGIDVVTGELPLYSLLGTTDVTVTAGGGGGGVGDPCDDPNFIGCQAQGWRCTPGLQCDPATCTCFDNRLMCDLTPATPACEPDNSVCAPGTLCDPSSCYCPIPYLEIKDVTGACDTATVRYSTDQGGTNNFYIDGAPAGPNMIRPAGDYEYNFGGLNVPGQPYTLSIDITNINGTGVDSISYTNECYPPPEILSIDPDPNPPIVQLQCRNQAFSVMFNQKMQTNNAENYFSFIFLAAGDDYRGINVSSYSVDNGINGCVTWDEGCTVFVVTSISLLPDVGAITFTIADGIMSVHNKPKLLSETHTYDMTDSIVCELDGVDVNPPYWLSTIEGASREFVAQGYSIVNGDHYNISSVAGVYAWDWSWDSEDPNTPNLITTATTDNLNTVTTPNRGQGSATITATARVTEDIIFDPNHIDRERESTAWIDIMICENPWPEPPPYDLGYSSSMMYCRGDDPANLLPNLINEIDLPIAASSTDLFINKIWTVEGTEGNIQGSDIIGLRIYDNPTHTSAAGWYQSQGFPLGSPSNTVIDGYSAVVDGRTTYIHFTNVDIPSLTAYSYIFVLSYNQDATAETKVIYRDLIRNLRFNKNITFSDKKNLQQDMDRIGGLGSIILKLWRYALLNDHNLPTLDVGTYLARWSTSRWPSWQARLGNALGSALPIDPDNVFNGCPVELGYDPISCFNNNLTPQFKCPDGSHIYIYQNFSDQYSELYANLKYKGLTWFGLGSSSGDDCYSYTIPIDTNVPVPPVPLPPVRINGNEVTW